MLLLGCDVARHDPDGELALKYRARHPQLARPVDLLVQRPCELALLLLALHPGRRQPEHGQRERRARDDLEQLRPRAQPAGEQLALRDAAADVPLQPRHAVAAQHEPHLEGAEAAAQRDLPVAVVGDEPAVAVRVAVDVQLGPERLLEPGAVGHEHARGVEVGQQPLVHVEVEGVEVRQVVHAYGLLRLGRHEGGPGVRGVDVHPDLALPRRRGCCCSVALAVGGRSVGGGCPVELGQGVDDSAEVVHGARVGGAERGCHEEGLQALGFQRLERRLEGLAGHGEVGRGGRGHLGVADAKDPGGLLGGRVGGGAAQGDEPAALAHVEVLELLRGDCTGCGEGVAQVLLACRDHHGEDGLAG